MQYRYLGGRNQIKDNKEFSHLHNGRDMTRLDQVVSSIHRINNRFYHNLDEAAERA